MDYVLNLDWENLMAIEASNHVLDTRFDVYESFLVDETNVTTVYPYTTIAMLAHNFGWLSGQGAVPIVAVQDCAEHIP